MPRAAGTPEPSAWILHADTPVPPLFGLSGEERLRRALGAAGLSRVSTNGAAPAAPAGSVLIFRADWLYDERLVAALRDAPGTLLTNREGRAVAAHAAGDAFADARAAITGEAPAPLGALRSVGPDELVPAYNHQLRKRAPALLAPLAEASPAALEQQLFDASYKGITDLVTKYVWPKPALPAVRLCARTGISPNAITVASWLLVLLALWLFAIGSFGLGLVAAWLMTFLDTVDGKLARVTLRSSRIGHVMDHGLDIVHPPFWWAAWGLALPSAPWVQPAIVVTFAGYVVHRLVEGLFMVLFKIEIHSWQAIDARFRLITTRRNPNLILLSGGVLLGRPDLGFAAVAAWTVLSILFHLVRIAQAGLDVRRGRAIRGWYEAAMGALLALGVALGSASALASAEPARGDPAARLLPAEHASDVWDLTIALSDGHWIVAQATISNLGPGGRTGAVVGHVVAPGGRTHEFHKVQRAGKWALSADRRTIDLGAIVLDQSGAHARFHVNKRRVDLEVRIDLGGGPVWSESLTGRRYGFDLLALAAPVDGVLQLEDDPEFAVSGHAVLTHRWMSAVEQELVERRVELFALEGSDGLYFTEVNPPAAPARRWLAVARAGRIVRATDEVSAAFSSAGLAIESAVGSGRIETPRVVLRDEPLLRAPWFARLWIGRLTRPRFVWSAAPFEFSVRDPGGAEPLLLSGQGLVDVARFDTGGSSPAAPDPGWGE